MIKFQFREVNILAKIAIYSYSYFLIGYMVFGNIIWEWSLPILRFIWFTAKAKMGWALLISILWKKIAIIISLKYAKMKHSHWLERQGRRLRIFLWKAKKVFNKYKKVVLTGGGILSLLLFFLIFVFPEFAITFTLKTVGGKIFDLFVLSIDFIKDYFLVYGGQFFIDLLLMFFFFIFDPLTITLIVIFEFLLMIFCRYFEFCNSIKQILNSHKINRQESLKGNLDKLKNKNNKK